MLRPADVVGGEVEEQRRVEDDAVHTAELHSLGGHLHDHMGTSGVRHLPQRAVEGDRLRRGVGAFRQELAPYVGPQRADHAGLIPGGGEDLPEHMGGGGLALGAGDGGQGQRLGGMAVKLRRQPGQGGAGLLHGGSGDPLRKRRAADHGGGPPGQRVGNAGAAVKFCTLHGHKERPRDYLPGIAGDGGDVRLLRAVRPQDRQKLGQLHRENSFPVVVTLRNELDAKVLSRTTPQNVRRRFRPSNRFAPLPS